MTLSIWRYSHLALAVSSFLFITVAALTGIVLAFEPIEKEWELSAIPTTENVTVAEAMSTLQMNYLEVLELSVTQDSRVKASVITEEGDVANFYINPKTGEKAGELADEAEVYTFARSLHRSLFLKSTGRFFIGLTSLLLFVISITGLVLIIKRQQSIQKFFAKILKDNFWQYAHTYFGRLFLIPIVLITLTGVLMSLFQFQVFEHPTLAHELQENLLKETPSLEVADFPIFQQTPLSEVRSIDFPFSSDVADYYQLNLQDREVRVNQFTGAVLSERLYPFQELAYRWSFDTHTGETNALWAFVLLLSAISILFFIVSGFKLTFKRRKGSIKNKFKASESTHVILVGSETGSTFPFAIWLQQQLIATGKKVFVAEMNAYETYPNLEQLLILTATYGAGEAPVNADKFIQRFQETAQGTFEFAIVGFGSFAYPDYCQFAYDVEHELLQSETAKPLLNLHTVNNRSAESFNQWLLQYGQVSGFVPDAYQNDSSKTAKRKKKYQFEVIARTALQLEHQTFMITLQGKKAGTFTSGDLLAIAPQSDTHDRLYSVGMNTKNQILLSIKLHDKGLCSQFLNSLQVGDTLQASRMKNKSFYFPKQARNVVMIATGTGIAPFLGMVQHNSKKIPTHLFWGAQNATAFEHYAEIINPALESKQLSEFIPAYSRATETKVYVQDKICKEEQLLANTFEKGGVVMICGSVVMQKAVLEVLSKLCKTHCKYDLSHYQKKGQLLMDCY
ncbi:sulfite reductase (NADPH) flavoprotein alpha-component [Pustulibacterium marinum]|uniref:NADPH--hemoprotein reductase n=1 Tax=Pustulibacterium marinum TaxID=1224947 RepID=A0A1I7GB61_9FLAO|nr:PepSY domain-containing protein [Pustulibacterium marinum]SFU45707.1 sulfite reductase (NADPH) flavoprotein alpha-component [Pustulibacterium marinum]